MRSALSKLPQLTDLKIEAGTPGTVSFKAAKDFDFRKKLDAIVESGVGPLKGYKVLD